jgi:hypothetical protein
MALKKNKQALKTCNICNPAFCLSFAIQVALIAFVGSQFLTQWMQVVSEFALGNGQCGILMEWWWVVWVAMCVCACVRARGRVCVFGSICLRV